jgi:hypothetical protein
MEYNDIINSIFELCGGYLSWLNTAKLYKDKLVKGVYWPIWIFFSVWGLWNLYYYPSVGHSLSLWAGVFLASGNIAWLILAIKYRKNK